MGNCVAKKAERPVTVAMLGVDNAGKTTIAKSLMGTTIDDVTPTVGFSSLDVKQGKFKVTIYDLGGGSRIRDIWKSYLSELHGILYIVDAGDHQRLEETGSLLTSLIENPRIQGKPILLLLNKQDKKDAVDEVDITEMLNLPTLVNKYKCPCRVDSCCANKGMGRKADPAIRSGFIWLLNWIGNHYEMLDNRVTAEKKAHFAQLAEEKRQKEERVRVIREQREKEENGEIIQENDIKNDRSTSSIYSNGHLPQISPTPSTITPPAQPEPMISTISDGTLPPLTTTTSIISRLPPIPEAVGLSSFANSSLPSVSPQIERRLPPIIPPSKSTSGSEPEGNGTPLENSLNQAAAAQALNQGLNPGTSYNEIEEAALAKRKRRRKRLRRLNKTVPSSTNSEDSELTSNSGSERQSTNPVPLTETQLANLPSSEPRPETPVEPPINAPTTGEVTPTPPEIPSEISPAVHNTRQVPTLPKIESNTSFPDDDDPHEMSL